MMNREIKFRGKRLDTGEWVYGYYCEIPAPPQCIGEPGKPTGYIVFENPHYVPDWNMPRQMVQDAVDPATVGQFTGLKDKNGTETYEGDILEDSQERKFQVRWDKDNGRFLGHHSKARGDTYVCYVGQVDRHDKPSTKVIGNIHDNPELLEQSP